MDDEPEFNGADADDGMVEFSTPVWIALGLSDD